MADDKRAGFNNFEANFYVCLALVAGVCKFLLVAAGGLLLMWVLLR